MVILVTTSSLGVWSSCYSLGVILGGKAKREQRGLENYHTG